MANIRNSISMTDHMTPALRSILKAMDSTLKAMEMLDKQSSKGMQSKAFQRAEKDIQAASNALIKMGNYAVLGNDKVQSSTEKSIRQMNLLEAAALGARKAMSKISAGGATSKIGTSLSSKLASSAASFKNFMAAPFANMQAMGTQMMNMSRMLGGSKLQGLLGGALQTVGQLGSNAMRLINQSAQSVGINLPMVFRNVGTSASQAFRTISTTGPPVIRALSSGIVTALSVARNTFTQFGSVAVKALSGIKNQASMTWTSIASGIYTIKQVMAALSSLTGLSDKVVSDTAKLNLHNYSDLSKSQAYGMAYQAAQASRSSISDVSNLASRISMSGVYGKGQGSLESSINTAEIIQKALAVGGGTHEENSRAILQLSQGLSSGKLYGDELRSIREQSPYLADVLAEGLAKVDSSFIGTTAGDLKELGAEGKLTSDVVIKAFEAMEDQIDKTFEDKAPRTWGQGVTSIMNTVKFFLGILQDMEGGPLQKITNLIWTISDYLQSSEGMQLLAGIATALAVIGEVLSFVVSSALNLISWLMDNAYILMAVFIVLGIAAMVAGIQALIAWIAAVWPLLLIIAVVALIIKIFLDMGFTFGDIVGAICGGIMVVIAFFKNLGLSIWGIVKGAWAVLKGLWTNTGLAFENVGLGIKSFFAGILSTVLGFVADIAAALNKLPFIEFDYGGITDAANYWAEQQASAESDIAANKAAMVDLGNAFSEAYNSVGAFSDGWASDAYDAGFEWGSTIVEGIGQTTLDITSAFDMSEMGAGDGATTIDGGNLDSVGSIGSDVDISDEDLKLLRDMAARDFLLQMQSVTPVAHVTFGDVRETADVNKIVEVIENMVEEQMATALVG